MIFSKNTPEMRFISDILRIDLWSKQVEIVNALFEHHYVAVRSGHGVGKTLVSAAIVLTFIATRHPSIAITTAPTYKQVEMILWKHIRDIYEKSLMPQVIGGRMLAMRYELSNNHFAVGLHPDETKPESFQGYHSPNILVILDESPGVSKTLYDASQSLLTTNAYFLQLGNPVGKGDHFYKAFQDPKYYKIHISCFDSPNVSGKEPAIPGLVEKGWIEGRKLEWGEDSILWRAKVLGEFPEEDVEYGIPLNWIELAFEGA